MAVPRIQNVDLAEARRDRAVGNGSDLLRLTFAAVERAAEMILVLAAEAVARVPKIDCISLVRHVAQHLANLAVFDLVKDLAGELKVVALLVDAPASVAKNVNAVLDVRAKFIDRNLFFAGLKRNVRHPLQGIRVPAIGISAAVGPFA